MLQVKSIYLGGMHANCYLVTDGESGAGALVDCPADSPQLRAFIGNTRLEYILLTHGHFDHIGGVAAIQRDYGAKVVISSQDEPMLSSGKLNLGAFMGSVPEKAQADILVEDGSELALGGTNIKVLSTPGHTKGSVCYLAGDCLFSGDTLFFTSCGRTDFPGGSAAEMRRSLKRLSELDGALKVFPGHDRSTTIAFEKSNNPYMR